MTCSSKECSAVAIAEIDSANLKLACKLVQLCRERSIRITTAESLTGGMIGSCITSVSGSSQIYSGGIISYTNEAKATLLNVSESTLAAYGAVSDQVACEMADGARTALHADYAIAVTGIAGPTGAEPGKPVGTVYIGLASPKGVCSNRHHFDGSRDDVRALTVQQALQTLLEAINEYSE